MCDDIHYSSYFDLSSKLLAASNCANMKADYEPKEKNFVIPIPLDEFSPDNVSIR